jgi:hypothetical protein
MTKGSVMRRWAVLVVLAVLVAGCGPAGPNRPHEPLQVHAQWSSCAEAVPDPLPETVTETTALPLLGKDFSPVRAVVCDAKPERRPDGGEDLVATEEWADAIDGLVAALRLPDERPTNGACTADLPLVAWFALLDADGRWVRPGLPMDACGKIRIEVREAVGALNRTRVSSRSLREIDSASAAKAGCSQTWADMVWVETAESGRTLAGGVRPFASDAASGVEVRLCVYRVPPQEQRTGKPAGTFERGGILPPQRWAAIAKAIVAAGPAHACNQAAGAFALLRRTDGTGGEVYVELDGCQRVLASGGPPPTLGQATPELLTVLQAVE